MPRRSREHLIIPPGPSVMIEFEEFGLTYVVLGHLFVARRNPEGDEVLLYPVGGPPVPVGGDDARYVIEFLHEHRRRAPEPDGPESVAYGGEMKPPGEPLRKNSAPSA